MIYYGTTISEAADLGYSDSTGNSTHVVKLTVCSAVSSHPVLLALAKQERDEHRARVSLDNYYAFWDFVETLGEQRDRGCSRPSEPRKKYGTANGMRPVPMLC